MCLRMHENDHVRTLKIMWSMSEFGGLWKHEKTQHARYNDLRFGSATLLQLAFLRESDPNFPWEKSYWDSNVYKYNFADSAHTASGT